MTTSLGMSGNLSRVKAGGPTAGGAVRKITIKPLKSKPKLPDGFEGTTWEKLLEAVRAVHTKRPVATSLEELYRAVENMCQHKMASRLYEGLQTECNAHIGRVLSDLAGAPTTSTLGFLQQVDVLWEEHCSQMKTLRCIFLYLDRTYVIINPGVRSLFDMGLNLFRTHLEAHPEQQRRVVSGLLELVAAERRGDIVQRSLLTHLVQMFSSLGTFVEVFQVPFLAETRAFYEAEGWALLDKLEPADYLLHCERRLQEELKRCQIYLEPSTQKPLIAVVEEKLLEAHLPALLERGFDTLMAEQRVPDLARLYVLAGRVRVLEAVRQALRAYLRKAGAALVMDEEKDKEMVSLLLKMKSSIDTIHRDAFQGSEVFGHAIKESFEWFINQRPSRPAELVAKFVDAELRAGNKGHNDTELEENLDKALMLFRYIQGKDVFEAFYKKDLAKRLLMGKSASTDAEKNMVAKLKTECGSQFTSKLEGMFKDIDLSVDVMHAFRKTASREEMPGGIDMNVAVLTHGYWPTYPIIEANLPTELNDYQQVFMKFYLQKHQGRRLQWHNSLGTCVLKAHFPKGSKELSVSLFQAVVLMLFNDVDELTLEEIADATGIEEKELSRTLQSLACGKIRALVKEPKGREIEAGDKFVFNKDFTAQLFRIKINSIQLKETVEEVQKTNDQVMQDRQYLIDAAIVRIMKTRKVLAHKLLVSSLIQQLRFPVRGSDLKKRIESLIERDYMMRVKGDKEAAYQYVA